MTFGNQQGPGQPGASAYGQGRPPAPGGNSGPGPGGFAMHPPQGAGPGGYGQQGPQPGAGYGQQGLPPGAGYGQKGPPPGASHGQQGSQHGGANHGQQGPQHGGAPPPPGSSVYGQQGPPRGGNNSPGVHWVNAADSFIPPNAVQGGMEKDGSPLFVARAMYKGGLHPGKAAQHIQDGGCSIGWGHKEVNVREYQVLCGDANQLRWVKQDGALSIQGIKPVDAGHEETGEPLYVAKALYEGSQQLGKCAPHIKKGMAFAYGHKERTTNNYLVLAYNH
ncbi:hypothetical protein H4R24_001413 [Coemansia sp. RSA 988]|nr:hypothetical protein H4R24_001413 [Coemansia sp. RSA 988]